MVKKRNILEYVIKDLEQKMVFIGGPRQVGKTTLSTRLISEYFKKISYLLWDNREDRKKILDYQFDFESELLVFDEIHKYKNWKNHIKGIYDKFKEKYKIIVTGSSRLNIFRKGGDSLQGRYHYHTLFPFSYCELENNRRKELEINNLLSFKSECSHSVFKDLYNYGGFPEPLIKQNEIFLRRWHNEKLERLFREDIRDMENIKDINSLKLLSDFIPERTSSLLSLNSLREDLSVSHKSVAKWIDILDSFYYTFRIYPYASKTYKSLKKEPKLYLYDWSEIKDEGKRFENMIAVHLLKFTNFLYENYGYKTRLNFLRDIEKREADFLVSVDDKIWFSAEVKSNDIEVSPNLKYFNKKLNITQSYQIVFKKDIDIYRDGVRVISCDKFLTGLI